MLLSFYMFPAGAAVASFVNKFFTWSAVIPDGMAFRAEYFLDGSTLLQLSKGLLMYFVKSFDFS